MRLTKFVIFTGLAATTALAGCSNSSPSLTTASVVPQQRVAAPAVNPACRTLSSQIAAARQEGTPGRVHAVATGKTKTAIVKRASIAKAAELDRLNQEFQSKCSTISTQQTARSPSIAAPATPSVSTAATALSTAKKVNDTIAQARAASQAAKLARSVTGSSSPIVAVPKLPKL